MPSSSYQPKGFKMVLSAIPTSSTTIDVESFNQDETSQSSELLSGPTENEVNDLYKKCYNLYKEHVNFNVTDFNICNRPFIEKLKTNLNALYSDGVFPLNDRDLIDEAIDVFREKDQEKEKVKERKREIMAKSKAKIGNYHTWTAKKSRRGQKTIMSSDTGTEPEDNFRHDFKGHFGAKTWSDEDVSEMWSGLSMSQFFKKAQIVINRGFYLETTKTINRLGPKH